MSLFGGRDEGSDDGGALEAEIRRLEGLTPAALAAEVMTKAFGPGAECEDPEEQVTVGGPNVGAGATVEGITPDMAPGGTTKGAEEKTRLRLQRLVAEGAQALEHAGLIRVQMHTAMNELDYTPTRFGRKVLASGKVEDVVATSVPRMD
jgi:hypothetical protein